MSERATWLVVVHYGDSAVTTEALRAVGGAIPTARQVVVDNSGNWPAVGHESVIRQAHNRGFAGGANVGLSHAFGRGADAVWLLNNDAKPPPGVLARLLETAGGDSMSIIGALEIDPRDQDPTGPNVARAPMLPAHLRDRVYVIAGPMRSVDFLPGFSLLIGRNAWERVGPLDEHYFHYFEDVDYSVRAARSGVRLVLDCAARIPHRRATALGRDSELETYYFLRNRLLLARHYHRGPAIWVWLRADPRHGILPLFSPRRLLRGDWSWLRGAWQGTLDALLGRSGPRP